MVKVFLVHLSSIELVSNLDLEVGSKGVQLCKNPLFSLKILVFFGDKPWTLNTCF